MSSSYSTLYQKICVCDKNSVKYIVLKNSINDIIQKWGTQEVSFAFLNLQDNVDKCDLNV